MTNADGRVDQPLLQGDTMEAGSYELVFDAGAYFDRLGVSLPEPKFLDQVVIRFGIADPERALPRAAAALALRILDLPGQLMADEIRFLLGDEERTLPDVSPTLTVLEYLRRHERRMGTKEGCAEGDCGACTVVLSEPDGEGGLKHRAVNSCIQFVSVLHGRQLTTVEDLKAPDGSLHPVQQALVDLSRLAVRVLHAGLCHAALCRVARGRADRPAGGEGLARGQSLPLHGIRADHRCGARGRRDRPPGPRARLPRPRESRWRIDDGAMLRLTMASAGVRAALARTSSPRSICNIRTPCSSPARTDVGLWVTKQHAL